MRLKLDENLPTWLVAPLTDLGHEIDTVRDEGLTGREDAAIWNAAQQEHRFFITQDLDFADARRYVPGTHEGLFIIRLRDTEAHALYERVLGIFATTAVEAWAGCIVIATDQKVRVQGPNRP